MVHPFYFLILPLCTLLMSLGLLLCWRWRPLLQARQHDLLWMSGCFALFSLGVTLQLLAVPAALDTNAVLSAALYHASVWCQAEAITRRLGVRMYRGWAVAAGLPALLALSYYAWVDDQLYLRIYLLNFGLAAQLGFSTLAIWRTRPQRWLERALRTVFGLFVISFLVRTLMTMPEQAGLNEDNFSQTAFWVVVQLCLLLFAMLFAMLYCAMSVQQALGQLHEERNADPLTSLLNRRAFFETLSHWPVEQPLGAVILCDVDHFKQVNDRWGHAMGDKVLQDVAQVLRESVRKTDLVARLGGEEFVLLLRGASVESAVQMAERIGARLSDRSYAEGTVDLRITASFGVAHVGTLERLSEAMQQADRLLYVAKAEGRNCVRWEPSMGAGLRAVNAT